MRFKSLCSYFLYRLLRKTEGGFTFFFFAPLPCKSSTLLRRMGCFVATGVDALNGGNTTFKKIEWGIRIP